jgi:hypothetical protein
LKKHKVRTGNRTWPKTRTRTRPPAGTGIGPKTGCIQVLPGFGFEIFEFVFLLIHLKKIILTWVRHVRLV